MAIVKHTEGLPVIHVSHAKLMKNPLREVKLLKTKLQCMYYNLVYRCIHLFLNNSDYGIEDVEELTAEMVEEFVSKDLYRSSSPVSSDQYRFFLDMESGLVFDKVGKTI